MRIAVPKEIMKHEGRVAAIPETVEQMVRLGHEVLIEHGAGDWSLHPDDDYARAGARIVPDPVDLYARADVVLKVKEPQMNKRAGKHEVDLLREGSDLIAFLHPASPSNLDMVQRLAARRIRSFTLDSIPRMPQTLEMDALASMSTVAGYKGVVMAVDALPKFAGEVDTPVGTTPSARAFVVGVGVAGRQAIATAKALGMQVTAYDVRAKGLERARDMGAATVDFHVPEEVTADEEGHPRPISEEWLRSIRDAIAPRVAEADIVILSTLVPGETAAILVTAEMVRAMRAGSVIVDISVDQGGNCEVTKGGDVIEYHGVTVNGIKNLPGRVRTHATLLFARNVFRFFAYLARDGAIAADRKDEIVRSTLVTCDGEIVHEGTLHALARRDGASEGP